ncbi:MAG TPA: pirin-like C-terminal cupin domain-containing protein [Puia sp.]|nr:pirin-like C-terminal cupin domain-containing protein [Puia sp.]
MATVILSDNLGAASASTSQQKYRTIYKIISPSSGGMGKMGLKNIIKGDYQSYVSPFFLLDEFGPMQLSNGFPFRVDAHPHAGIIPTTYLLKGTAHHRDSMGNDFEYKAGDFIQFTSGKGALHMEETGDELYKNGGVFHGFQGCLNIPPKLRKSEPSASHTKEGDISIVEKENTKIRVMLGEVFGVKSKTHLLMPVVYWHISMKENATIELPVEAAQNVFIYLQEGQLEINSSQSVKTSQTVLFERDANTIQIKANEASEFLVLGGEVNNEPYIAEGPFVLNNEQEIRQAYIDFQKGKFGDLAKTNGKRRQTNIKF